MARWLSRPQACVQKILATSVMSYTYIYMYGIHVWYTHSCISTYMQCSVACTCTHIIVRILAMKWYAISLCWRLWQALELLFHVHVHAHAHANMYRKQCTQTLQLTFLVEIWPLHQTQQPKWRVPKEHQHNIHVCTVHVNVIFIHNEPPFLSQVPSFPSLLHSWSHYWCEAPPWRHGPPSRECQTSPVEWSIQSH